MEVTRSNLSNVNKLFEFMADAFEHDLLYFSSNETNVVQEITVTELLMAVFTLTCNIQRSLDIDVWVSAPRWKSSE